jgi:rod shape-determining protein MreC
MKKFLRHPFFISLFLILILLFLDLEGWLAPPRNIFLKVVSPWQKISFQISLKANNFLGFVAAVKDLKQENELLRKERLKLLAETARLKEAGQENEFLRSQMGLPLEEGRQLVFAEVIGGSPAKTGRYFLIDKGRRDGIEDKAAVIVGGNILVGQIVEVNETASKVRLINDPNSKISGRIQESGITGLVTGEEDFDLIIDLLPQGEKIEKGQIAVSSGSVGYFPSGLLIGEIEEVISSEVNISQKARIKPAADFRRIDKVFVIK